ncbi:MAG: adenylate kinase [Actinomycetota bacterium]|nr:adenylate kinase [Actinomycetota bacterium]
MRRICVVGNSGSGKTTMAAGLASALSIPHLELDSVFHQSGWQPLEREEFRRRVADFTAGPAWVVDGNYSTVRDIVWSRADTVIWLDLPRHQVMRQLARRTLRRMATGEELWNGNRERWQNLTRFDPEQSILVWAWTRHRVYRSRYEAAQHDPANAHLAFIRVRSPGQAAALLRGARAG